MQVATSKFVFGCGVWNVFAIPSVHACSHGTHVHDPHGVCNFALIVALLALPLIVAFLLLTLTPIYWLSWHLLSTICLLVFLQPARLKMPWLLDALWSRSGQVLSNGSSTRFPSVHCCHAWALIARGDFFHSHSYACPFFIYTKKHWWFPYHNSSFLCRRQFEYYSWIVRHWTPLASAWTIA